MDKPNTVTAQAFREAAAQLYERLGSQWRDLLLAAADQRDQWDLCELKRQLHHAHSIKLERELAFQQARVENLLTALDERREMDGLEEGGE